MVHDLSTIGGIHILPRVNNAFRKQQAVSLLLKCLITLLSSLKAFRTGHGFCQRQMIQKICKRELTIVLALHCLGIIHLSVICFVNKFHKVQKLSSVNNMLSRAENSNATQTGVAILIHY